MSQAVVMTIEDQLQRLWMLDDRINAKVAEISELWAKVTNTSRELDGMPHADGNTSDPVGNWGITLADLKNEADALTDEYVDLRWKLVDIFQDNLPLLEFRILHKFYILRRSTAGIAKELGLSVRHVNRLRTGALRSLESRPQMSLNVP